MSDAHVLPIGENLNLLRPADHGDWLEDGTAYLMSKPERTRPTRVLLSAGDLADWSIGTTHDVFHDQTRVRLGRYTVVAIVRYRRGEIVDRGYRQGFDEMEAVEDRKYAAAVFK